MSWRTRILLALTFVGAPSAIAAYVLSRPPRVLLPPVAAEEDQATLAPFSLRPPTPKNDELFGVHLMGFSIALDRSTRDGADLTPAEATLLAARGELGDGEATALANVVTVAKTSSRAPPLDMPSVTALDVAVARLDNALLASKQPYFIDVNVITDPRADSGRGRRIIVFYEYAIAQSNLYETPELLRVRSVRVRRLDRLNWKQTSLGFVNPHRAQATVLLDQVDEQLVRHVLPALADHAPMPLTTEKSSAMRALVTSASTTWRGLTQLAGEHARAELGKLPNVEESAARDLGEALQERTALYEKWNADTKEMSAGIRAPFGLALDLDLEAFERDHGHQVAFDELESLRHIQQRLADPDLIRTYTALRDAYAGSIERHEIQHRLDLKQGLVTPPVVLAAIRGDSTMARDLRESVANELSGYLAQLARDEASPKTTLTLLMRFLINPRTRTSTEAYVATIATEELARELGVKDVAPVIKNGRLDEARLIYAHRELTTKSGASLTKAARNVWKRLFERDLETIKIVPPQTTGDSADAAPE